MMLDPAMAGLNEMDPAGAQARSSLQGSGLKGMTAGAFPLLYNAGNALVNTLAPTPAGAGEPTPAQGIAKENRLQQLDALIADQIQKKNDALKKAETQSVSRTGPRGNRTSTTTNTAPSEEQALRIAKPFDDNIANYQRERETLLPWSQTAPAWERAIVEHAPEISFGFGTGAGLLTKGPVKSMVIGGLGSLGEGAFASTWPTVQNMHLPENSPAGIEARKNWHSGDWWLNNVLPEIGEAGVLGAIGGKTGNMVRQGIGQPVTAIRNLTRGEKGAPPAPTAPQQAPSAPSRPQPWTTPKIAPYGQGIGKNGPYYSPNPPGGPQSLTQRELDALIEKARGR